MRTLIAVLAMMLLAGAGEAAQRTGLPDFVVPDCLGTNIHFTGREQKQVDQLAAGGFKFIRMDFFWGDVETKPGEYNFKPYDELKQTLDSRGIRPLFILCYNNKLYDGGVAPHTDEGRAAYAKFAKAAAAHFKGQGILWEIWNEPNGSNFWHPEANVGDYVKLAQAAYPALKEGDSGCTVLAPALAGWDFAYLENAFKLGLLDCTDVVSVHPYGAPKPEDVARYVSTVKSLIEKYGPKGKDLPIVSGEWGYSCAKDITAEQQGRYLARMFLNNMMNDMRLSIWYDWHDDGTDPKENEHHFGTVAYDFKEKPAYAAARTLTSELNGYSCATRINLKDATDEDYFLLFKKGDDYRMAAWTTGKSHSVRIPIDVKSADIVSIVGEKKTAGIKDDAINLELSGSVQYIEPAGQSHRWAVEDGWKVFAKGLAGKSSEIQLFSSTKDGKGEVSVSGDGVRGVKPAEDDASKGKESGLIVNYVWSGEDKAKVRVTLKVEGMKEPLVRIIEVDASYYPKAQVLPPSGMELLFAVSRPLKELKESYKGRITVGNTEGIIPVKNAVEFEMTPGQDKKIVRLKLAQAPAAMFSFAGKLLDEDGKEVMRLHAKRYCVIETFADGKVGQPISRFQITPEGDDKIKGEAKFVYAVAPSGGASDICAKLTYNADPGWKFFCVSARPMLPVFERPSKMVAWVKGDSNQGSAKLRYLDSGEQTFQPDFGIIDFGDWKCMEADLSGSSAGHWGGRNDGVVSYPIKWDTLFLLDCVGKRMSGTVYLGPMMLCYD